MKPSNWLLQHQQHIGRLLAIGVLQGRWSLEDLDNPTQSWLQLEADRRSLNSQASRGGYGLPYPPPASYRNLAREWIDANPADWEDLFNQFANNETPSIDLPPLAA